MISQDSQSKQKTILEVRLWDIPLGNGSFIVVSDRITVILAFIAVNAGQNVYDGCIHPASSSSSSSSSTPIAIVIAISIG